MKYESTILKRLIDTYGVVGNPRYISEIIKEFIVRGKECFPNLFTYQADWLAHIDEFGLNPTYTVSYTGQSIYAPNTLERPVKSAILKGQTLVNLVSNGNVEQEIGYSVQTKAKYRFNKNMINQNKEYLLLFDVSNLTDDIFYISFNHANETGITYITNKSNGIMKVKVNFSNVQGNISDVLIIFHTNSSNKNPSGYINDVMLIPYQQGMENWDIPYFEGMQSVKMPILTTTGKNLIPQDYQQGNWNQWSTRLEESSKCITSKDYIDVSTIKDTVTTTISDGYKYAFCFYGKNKEHIYIDDSWGNGFIGKKTFNFKTEIGYKGEIYYIRINITKVDGTDIKPDEIHNIGFQIEKGTTATTYEPHKSNILSCLEQVELGSVGEVKDELNLLTQQLTQRTETRPYQEGDELNSEFVTDMTNTRYKLAQEVVKTVDLTILDQNGQNVKQLMSFNGGTHFNTTSLEGSPLPVVSVSVETDLEETLMMCSLEGYTM